jgi:hypothetical protein
MPFSGPNDPELPDQVQEMPEEKRDLWVSTWNAAFDRCVNESGEDCEGKAFRIANSAIEENADTMIETIRETLYTELTALIDGKPFDGFTHSQGEKFIDMLGRELEVKRSELKIYLENTLSAIEATRGEDGELVGLPIDAANHDHGDAAGWIVGAELVGDIIRLIPRWTSLGLEKVGEGLRRMFSPSVDPVRKFIAGGSLTNWPGALNMKTGNVLLRPIELSQGFYVAEKTKGESLVATVNDVMDVATTTTDEGAVFVATSDETQLSSDSNSLSIEPQEQEVLQEETEVQEGVLSMEITEEKLAELIEAKVTAGVESAQKKVLQPDLNGDSATELSKDESAVELTNILKALGQEDFEEKATEELTQFFLEKEEAMRERASQMAVMKLANIRRESNIAEFSQAVTGGTNDHPRGLPVPADRINAFLLSLKPDQATEAQEIFESIQHGGLVEFNAKGHNGRRKGIAELDADMSKLLTEWVENGGNMSEFFKTNADVLGDIEQYNLSVFNEKGKE